MLRTANSRLTRTQGKKIARQSVAMIVFSIVAVLVFFLVIMPRLINLFFNFLGTGDISFKEKDEVPPQVPIILPFPDSIKDAVLTIEGFAEAKSKVVVVKNGEQTDEIVVDDKGSFEYQLTLTEGENKLSFYGVDEAGNESNTTNDMFINLDNEAPILELENLTDGQEILAKENQNYAIKGKTEPHSKLHINDRSVYVDGEGSFKFSYYLQEGDNELKFKIEDRAGNVTEQTLMVKFRL